MLAVKLLLACWIFVGCAFGQTASQPCLAVYPQPASERSASANVAPVMLPFALAHKDRFLYLESRGLGIKDVKAKYKKSDLEKLEVRGVKIIVTTKETSGAPSAPAGCN